MAAAVKRRCPVASHPTSIRRASESRGMVMESGCQQPAKVGGGNMQGDTRTWPILHVISGQRLDVQWLKGEE